ncbi:MAG: hypothetical protein GBAus27B_000513 [Mycoplasmataceae bacterium]|nr:MAG: hypothetical protein GBAus27B_000513 [Mycoplasmataceae bacterium]
MNYNNLFQNGSLKFIYDFVDKIVHQGLGVEKNLQSEHVTILVSALIVVFLLYKLAWLVFETMKFIISKIEW